MKINRILYRGIHTPSRSLFLLCFLHELLMSFTNYNARSACNIRLLVSWGRLFKARAGANVGLKLNQRNEYNWNATSIVIDGKIMKPNFA